MNTRAFLQQISGLSPERLPQTIVEAAVVRTLRKGELLIRQGETQEHVIFWPTAFCGASSWTREGGR